VGCEQSLFGIIPGKKMSSRCQDGGESVHTEVKGT
jgi:hypothetical protein